MVFLMFRVFKVFIWFYLVLLGIVLRVIVSWVFILGKN